MENENFEKILINMTKPEISDLKHQDLLADAIADAKERTIVSWWWLIIPGYIIATLLMKSIYMPSATLVSNVHYFIESQRTLAIILFIIMPVIFILFNFLSIRKVYLLLGSPDRIGFLKIIWLNVVIIIFSFLILLIYFL
jgi:hypothetical protein